MAIIRITGQKGGPLEEFVAPGDVLGLGESLLGSPLTTVGAGVWTGALIGSGLIYRTGPVGGYTDTTDTAVNILAALTGSNPNAQVIPGTSWRMRFVNTVAQALTFAAGTGVVSGLGTLNVAASLWRDYLWTVLQSGQAVTLQSNTTNASAAVTFVLPSGVSSFLMGVSPLALNIMPGQTVSGTGVTAGTTVLSVNQGQGGITGVTLSANATATSVAGGVPLTFGPTIRIDTLGSGTL